MIWTIVLQPKHTIEAAVPDPYYCVTQSCDPCAYSMDMCMITTPVVPKDYFANFQLLQLPLATFISNDAKTWNSA